jgi:hypothetical protein
MSELGRDSRALLTAARAGDDPSPADRTRLRQRLIHAGVGFGIAATASSTAAAAASSSAAAGGGAGAGAATAATGMSSFGILAAKIVTVAVFAGGVGTGTVKAIHVYEARHGSALLAASHPAAGQVTQAAGQSGAPGIVEAAEAPQPEALPIAPTPPVEAPLVETPRVVAPAANTPPPSTRAAAVVHASTLDAETGLLKSAEVAMRAGDAQLSLGFLDDHAARFPDGILAQERAAQRVLVLCALGRMTDARSDAQRFLREHPRSPLADRVRASCVGGIP